MAENEPLLHWFNHDDLPDPQREVAAIFDVAAHELVEATHANPDRTIALRKLLEARDAAIRARVAPAPDAPIDQDPEEPGDNDGDQAGDDGRASATAEVSITKATKNGR